MYLVLKCTNMRTIENDIPNCYIEYTNMSFEQRKHYHLYNSQVEFPKEIIHNVIKYIGAYNFKWEILDEVNDEDEAKELVEYYQNEYKCKTIGYNRPIFDENMAGENNPRFDDHRTWNEIHGKEKADEMKKKQSETFKNNENLRFHMKKRLEVWNPMDNPEAREKVRQSKIGIKNPKAIYDYILTKDDETIKIECIREFCRNNKNFKKNGLLHAIRENREYKGYRINKVLKEK